MLNKGTIESRSNSRKIPVLDNSSRNVKNYDDNKKEISKTNYISDNPENLRDGSYFVGIQLNELTDFENLTENTNYYWRIRPKYNTCWTEVVLYTDGTANFVFNAMNNNPNPPTEGFSPSNDAAVATLTPIISWNNATDPDYGDNSDVLRYTIEIDTTNTFATIQETHITDMGTTFVLLTTELLEGYRYYYRVKTI
ncbi:MAG: hypothetical protein K8S23_01885 [Candidatus Cloacimonetes bacterium]|nr:hypothetical protein [Candidatus Cloacimonadota bacterium]